jgi:hypothetical protein
MPVGRSTAVDEIAVFFAVLPYYRAGKLCFFSLVNSYFRLKNKVLAERKVTKQFYFSSIYKIQNISSAICSAKKDYWCETLY